MHTRGKGLVVNGVNDEKVDETDEGDSGSLNDEVTEEKVSFSSRPGSSTRSRRTPTPSGNNETVSPVLVRIFCNPTFLSCKWQSM